MASARVSAALLVGAGGVALAAAALAGAAWIPRAIGTIPGTLAAEVAGGALLAFALLLALTAKREIGSANVVPAHVAFSTRANPDNVVPVREPRAAVAVATQPLDAHHQAVMDLDVQIREITKRINKAAVLLATHKLSKDGYAKLVGDLKRERATLETERVHLELRKHAH